MSPAGGDLTVEQYAGISAAIADGYPLDAVLANEGMALGAWPDADIAWKQRLVADPTAFESYRARLGEAEDWLGRKVTPLDEDLGAWLGFLGAYAAHAAPFDLLVGLGLGLSDLGRLQRRWSKRLAEDQELARQAAELAKSKPSAVPRVSAAKGVLTPFPWSKKGAPLKAAPAQEKSAGADEDFDLAQYAALLAELTIAPKEKERALRRHGLVPSSLAALRARWDARIEADAAVAQDYHRLFAHHRARFEAALRSAGDLPRREAPAPAPAFAAHPDLIVAPPLTAAPIAPKEAVIAARPAPSPLAGTSLTVDVPRGPALPFTKGIAPKEIAEGAPDEPKPKRSSLGETALAVDVPRGPALPFHGEMKEITAAAPVAPAAPPAPRPAPSPLAGTSLAVDIPRGPALPFDPSARVAPAIATASPHEPKVQRAPANLGGTSLAVDIPRGPALPFAAREATDTPRGSSPPAPPPPPPPAAPKRSSLAEVQLGMEMPKNLPRAKPAYAPALTLEQHASLAVELAAAPEKTAETLARYRLTPEARAELDAHYREKIAASAETRAAWERAYHSYHAWLAANRRPAR